MSATLPPQALLAEGQQAVKYPAALFPAQRVPVLVQTGHIKIQNSIRARPQMYEARKICNLLIARSSTHKFPLTNLRLNKLLYFIHGWALTSSTEGLIRNHFLAWNLGPVIRPVYDAFKEYGEGAINRPATYLDYIANKERAVSYDDIPPNQVALIERIFASYDQYPTGKLVQMTHVVGGPWHATYSAWAKDNRVNLRIPNELMREHFLREAGGQSRH